MLGGGMIIMQGLSMEAIAKFQTELMKMVMAIEDHYTELAILANQPCVILCDRGVLFELINSNKGYRSAGLYERRNLADYFGLAGVECD